MTRLSTAALPHLNVPRPRYDRSAVRTGIVHIGVGGFYRAHQALFIERLLDAGASEWGVCGVGTQPADQRMRDALRAQDGLYTLVVRAADGCLQPRVIGALVDYLYAPDDPWAVVERMADPATRIVSLTITEGGYDIDPPVGEFSLPDPDLLLDLDPRNPPRTPFGLLTAFSGAWRAARRVQGGRQRHC